MAELALSDDEVARFWAKVEKREPADCWLWTGWRNVEGYGRFDLTSGNKPLATHLALILSGQPRPPAPFDKALHGDCSNPACCNPAHLRWGSAKENAGDRERLGRRDAARGEANGGAKITEEVVRYIRRSRMTQKELGRVFGLSRIWVGMIKRREVWQHVA